MNHGQQKREQKELKKAQERGVKLLLCPFPDCGKTFIPVPGTPNVCPDHRKLIADVGFIMAHLARQVEKAKSDEGPAILVPKPGQGEAAIKAAAAGSKLKGVNL